MKKQLYILFAFIIVQTVLLAQAPPQGINYQAMVYVPYSNQQVGANSAGQIPANNAQVRVNFAIENGFNGQVIYEETQLKNTDNYGLLTAVIGTGTPLNNNIYVFNQINWGQIDAYLRVTIVLTRFNTEVESYQKLWSVPYAFYTAQAHNSMYADTSRFATVAGNGITGVTDNGNGTLTFNYYDGSTYTTGQLSGLTGPQGPAGATGPQGATGANGLSAYQIWLQQGNTGTQTDFLNSITGPQGATGLTGAQGPIGPQGPQGATGPQGPAGNGFNNGTLTNQIMYWNGSSWTMLNPGVSGQVLAICNNNLTWVTVNGVCSGSILTLNCAGSSNTGTLTAGVSASGVSSSIPYTGGNGGTHNGQTVSSTGVTGLTATLVSGNFATGAGNLVYSITGTPNTNGTASFALNIGGQTCVLTRTVSLPVGTITGLSCGTATNTGTLTSGTAASGVSSSIPYTGGNGGTHNGQTVSSTGVTGLTATLVSGNFATGAGNLVYTITGTPNTNGTASFALNIGGQTCVLTRTVSLPVGIITGLSCGTATNTGTLTSGTAASGVSSSIPCTGGNGGTHNGQTVSSTGVTGLTATLVSGNFATGAGSLVYTITGTPNTNGTASFALNIGGQTCALTLTVSVNLVAQYPSGSVFCASGPTAIVEVTNPTTGKVWMDRNLGASQVATSSTDANSYGDLYQWGRRSDGHQCRTSATTSTLSSVDQPAHGNFILAPNTPFDWRSPQNTNLWQGVNGVNNPCPIGFRIPTINELDSERQTWSSQNPTGAYSSILKFSLPGTRGLDGLLYSVGLYSGIYSSTIVTTYVKSLDFYSTGGGNALVNSSFGRGNGLSVRCIKN